MNYELLGESQTDSIVSDNNGRSSIRKSSFGKKVRMNKRDDYTDELIKEFGGLPKKNETLMLKTIGLSDTGSIMRSHLRENIIDELYIATWIISRQNIDAIIDAIDNGKIKQLVFVISNRQRQLKKADYAYLVEQFKERENIKFRVVNSHAKTFSFSSNNDYYTVVGSGNWTTNPRIEVYQISNNKDVFQFNKDWMIGLM